MRTWYAGDQLVRRGVCGAGATTEPTQRGLPRHTKLRKEVWVARAVDLLLGCGVVLQGLEIGNEIGNLFAKF
jgi:hypothetical protein